LLSNVIEVGACRVTLEIERRWIPWGGTMDGTLILEGGARPQKLALCQVELLSQFQGITPVSTKVWEVRQVEAGERRPLPFTLRMGWGTSTFGEYGLVRACLAADDWLRWPRLIGLTVDVVPPPEFVRAAAHLAELTELELGTWEVVGAGDGAALSLHAKGRDNPLRSAYIELYRGPDRDYGEVVLEPRRGAPGALKARRRMAIRFHRDDPAEILRAVRACVEPVLTQAETLPIPSDLPEPDPGTLPLPAEPNARRRDLPRPASGEEE
jgi:hypothetical protein